MKLNKGIEYFEEHQDEAVGYISTELDYSEGDARAWLGTVKFAKDVRNVDQKVVGDTIGIIEESGGDQKGC